MQYLEGSGTPVLYIGRTVRRNVAMIRIRLNYFRIVSNRGLCYQLL
jgi:hypothetical protein